jgi:branched-chain amino acid transport system ATP-binding protein
MLLEMDEITAGYGSLIILHQVSLTLLDGEIVCIIGPNGAGKTTVLRVVSGQIAALEGRITFNGEDITYQDIAEKGRKGLIIIPQGDNVFPNLTIFENLEIGGTLLQDQEMLSQRIEKAMEKFPVLRNKRKHAARERSGGERQMLALSRILILQPHLALLDEPSLGLAPLVVDSIFQEILNMNEMGISFLLVEQNARKGLSVSHRGYVLELGENRLAGTGQELLENREVQRLYLGG